MAHIRPKKRADGTNGWHVQIRLTGHPPATETFDRKTDAKNWAQRVEADMKAGRYSLTAESKRHSLVDMIDRYLQDVLPQKKPSTRRSQGGILRWWKRRIGHLVLADVTPSVLSDVRDELLRG